MNITENVTPVTVVDAPATKAPAKAKKAVKAKVKAKTKKAAVKKVTRAKGDELTVPEKVAKFAFRRWVPRKVLCKKFNVVDNTMRCILGKLSHVPGYDLEYRKSENGNFGEYNFKKIPASLRA
jgi:hypothetical protein